MKTHGFATRLTRKKKKKQKKVLKLVCVALKIMIINYLISVQIKAFSSS